MQHVLLNLILLTKWVETNHKTSNEIMEVGFIDVIEVVSIS